jgi:hypothetical protein
MMTSRHALFLAGVLATQAAFSGVLTAAERPAAAAGSNPGHATTQRDPAASRYNRRCGSRKVASR